MLELLAIIDAAQIHSQALSSSEIVFIADFDSTNSKQIQSSIKNTSNLIALESESVASKITADNANFNYSGRIDRQDPQAPAFSFPGTAVEFKFTGTSLKLELSEDNWGGGNYIDVYLDGDPNPTTIELKPEGSQPIIYDIAEGLSDKVHQAVVVKRNDYMTGKFDFHGIIIDGQLLPANPDSTRKIEVYGDSITAGAAVEHDATGVRDPEGNNDRLSNAYHSYASMLARDYDAELSLVAQSGASLMDGFGFWNQGIGAETFYDRFKPLRDAATWNFSDYHPDLVIIALGQNDSSTINIGKDVSARRWKQHYKRLIANLRAKYPHTYFIGMFPNMYHDRQWDNYIIEAIAEYRTEHNDDRVFSLIHDQVTPGHPRISEQQQMANTLKELIDTTLTENGFNWDVAEQAE